jgi:hypothetical protein
LFGALFSFEQKDEVPQPVTTTVGAASLNASFHMLNGTIPSLHARYEKQRLLFFAELLVWLQPWHCHKAARVVADLSTLAILPDQKLQVGDQCSHSTALLATTAKQGKRRQ